MNNKKHTPLFIIVSVGICFIGGIFVLKHYYNSNETSLHLTDTVRQGLAKAIDSEHEAAITDYDTAISRYSDDAAAHYYRGRSKYELGEYFAAISDFQNVIRLKPKLAEAYFSLALAYSKLGEHGDAVAAYNTVIDLQPKNSMAYNNRGRAKAQMEEYLYSNDSIIREYSTAIRLDPDNVRAYYNRAIAFCQEKRYLEAITDFDETIRLYPVAVFTHLDFDAPSRAYGYYLRGKAKQFLLEENGDFTMNPEAKQDLLTAFEIAKAEDNVELKNKIQDTLFQYNIPINKGDN